MSEFTYQLALRIFRGVPVKKTTLYQDCKIYLNIACDITSGLGESLIISKNQTKRKHRLDHKGRNHASRRMK